MKKLIILVFLLLGACTVHTKSEAEKVVIVTRTFAYQSPYTGGDAIYKYKVNRIEKGVVDFIEVDYRFEIGDTILYQFWK